MPREASLYVELVMFKGREGAACFARTFRGYFWTAVVETGQMVRRLQESEGTRRRNLSAESTNVCRAQAPEGRLAGPPPSQRDGTPV